MLTTAQLVSQLIKRAGELGGKYENKDASLMLEAAIMLAGQASLLASQQKEIEAGGFW